MAYIHESFIYKLYDIRNKIDTIYTGIILLGINCSYS